MMLRQPPTWMDRLLEWYCTDYYLEEVQGDLHEWYARIEARQPRNLANLRYLLYVLRYFSWFRLKPFHRLFANPNPLTMKNLVLLTYRHLKKDKLTGVVRLGNLVLGISVFLLALIFARYELSYDAFHEDADQIYRVGLSSEGEPWAATPTGLGANLLERSSEVKSMTRLFPMYTTNVYVGEEVFREQNGFWADSTVADVFSLTWLQGNPRKALTDPQGVVLTESLARKYFGEENPMGKTIRLNADYRWSSEGLDRTVTGVIADLPAQTSLDFDFLGSVYPAGEQYLSSWRNLWVYTFIKTRTPAEPLQTQELVQSLAEEKYGLSPEEAADIAGVMTPLQEIHLFTNHEKEYADNGDAYYVYVLFSIGLFVLIIACINFVNLTIIRGLDRAKEVGLRKTIGASRTQLVLQFMGETLVLLTLAGLVSIGVLILADPLFQQFSGLDLPLNVLEDPAVLVWLGVILLVVELFSGIYPAWVLSRIQPADSVKSGGSMLSLRHIGTTRQALIVTQFTLSLVLVISSLVVYRQLNYLQQKNLGFEKDQILVINANYMMRQSYESLRGELLKIPGVQGVGNSSSIPVHRIMMEEMVRLDQPERAIDTRLLLVDPAFLQTYDLKVVEGTTFTAELGDEQREIVLNQTAVKTYFEDENSLGESLVVQGDTVRVVGVVEDFNFQSLHASVEPLTMLYRPERLYNRVSVKFNPQATSEVLAGIQDIREELFSTEPPLEIDFLSDRFAQLYEAETKLQTVVWVFCIITVLLTLSGILGVATYNSRKRAKELAVRKVLGGSTLHLLQLMARSFLLLLVISLVLGVAGAWYLSEWWLTDYAYRIPLPAGSFVGASVILFLLVIGSAMLVALRTAKANPASVLKSE